MTMEKYKKVVAEAKDCDGKTYARALFDAERGEFLIEDYYDPRKEPPDDVLDLEYFNPIKVGDYRKDWESALKELKAIEERYVAAHPAEAE